MDRATQLFLVLMSVIGGRTHLVLACIAYAALPTTALCETRVVARIGNVAVAVPAPNGFSDPSNVSGELRRVGEAMTPPTNRLLALFVSDADAKRAVSGMSVALDRYFMVQTLRKLETTTLSTLDFSKFREVFKQQQRDFLDRNKSKTQQNLDAASRQLRRELQDPTLDLKVDETRPLGVFHDGDTFVGMAALIKYSSMVNGKSEEVPMAMAMTIALIKGKIIYFYAYRNYLSDADVEWTRNVSKQWVTALARAN